MHYHWQSLNSFSITVTIQNTIRTLGGIKTAPLIEEKEDLSSSVGAAGRKPAIMAAEMTKSALNFEFCYNKEFVKFSKCLFC